MKLNLLNSGFQKDCLANSGQSALRRSRAPKFRARRSCSRGPESGFAYLLAMMMVMALIIMSAVAAEKGIAQARRQREQLAIWRGEQYVRAIRMYYKKTQHYPQTIDDLKKGAVNIHFLRPEAYKNPMNKEDGSWRFIYVNPTGQLIGSVRYANLQQMALIVLNNGQMPALPTGQPASGAAQPSATPPATPPTGDASGNSTPPDNSQHDINATQPQPGDPGLQQGQAPQNGLQSLLTAPGGTGVNPLLLMKPTGPVTGPVVGGFLTGVALIPDKPSQKVYQGGKKYIQWEFIWNPMVDQARAIQAGGNGGATGSIGGANGTPAGAGSGILGGTGNGMNGGGLFPTAPNQPPTQPQQPQQPQSTPQQ
jgi:hypothetical protein